MTTKSNRKHQKRSIKLQDNHKLETVTIAPTDIFYNENWVNQTMKMAETFHNAKCFNRSIQNKEQAFVLLMYGRQIGLSPIDSMNGLGLVEGHVIDWGQVMVSIVTRAGYRATFDFLENKIDGEVKIWNDKESYTYIVKRDDPMIKGKLAMTIAPINKMFYHGVRQLIKLKLSHIRELHQLAFLYASDEVKDLATPLAVATAVSATGHKPLNLDNVSVETKRLGENDLYSLLP